jgi:site-specific recombinase XerD
MPPLLKPLRLTNGHEPMTTLEEAVKRFLLTKATLDEDTKVFYAKALAAYCKVSPEWPPTLETVVRFVNHYQAHFQDSTTYVYFTVLKMFIAWLVKKGFIGDDPFEDLSPPSAPEELPRAPSPEILKCLFIHLESQVEGVLSPDNPGRHKLYGYREIRDLAFFSLLYDTGLRIGEACGILIQDIDLKAQSVFIRAAKRKRQRFVAIGNRTRADLRLWLGVRSPIELEPAYLFLRSYRGWGKVTPAGMEEVLQQYCVKLTLDPRFTPHTLRHAFVDNALRAGADIRDIQAQLGHLSLRTTFRYARGVSAKRLEDHLKTSPRDLLFRGR